MDRRVRDRIGVAIICGVGACGTALAEPPPSNPLAGPRVPDRPPSDSPVERDFNNQVRRPDSTPEEKVLALLKLDDMTKAAVDRLISARRAILDSFVIEHTDLLTKAGAAGGTGKAADLIAIGLEAFQALAPIRQGGSLWEQIAGALPPEPAREFNTKMNEYWDAIVAEKATPESPRVGPLRRFQIVSEERLRILGEEIKHSFESMLASGTYVVEYFTRDLRLSESQKARVREMTLEFTRETQMKPTDKQQEQLLVRVASILSEEQRLKLAAKIVPPPPAEPGTP